MKKTIMGFLLAMVLCLALLPAQVFAADVVTVYLDPVSGSDEADGLTEAAAVLTVAKAYEKFTGATSGKLVFLDTLTLEKETSFPKTTVPVVITSKDGSQGIASNNAVRFFGPTTLENMTITLTKAAGTASQSLYGEGKKFVIGENVTSVGTDGYYYSVSGGSRWSTVTSTDLTVMSGTWRNGYAAAYGYTSSSVNANVTKDAKITVTGGHFTGFLSPMYSKNTIGGNVEISVSNAVVSAGIYASPASSGTVSGNVTVTIGAGVADVSPLYAGSTGSGSVTGTVTIVLDGADHEIPTLSGKGLSSATGTVGASRLLLKSGTLFAAPKNFTFIDVAVDTGKTLTISGVELQADTLTSAGTLKFSGVSKLTAQQVTGVVSCDVEGDVLSNHGYLVAPAGSNITFAPATGVTEDDGVWRKLDLENFQGLVLTAAEGVTFDLYKNFGNEESAENLVEPYMVVGNYKFYPTITGRYHWAASGAGRYSMRQNVWMSEEEAMTRTEIDVTPGLVSGVGGWEATNSVVRLFTEEFLEKVIPSDPDLWPEYKHLLVTPAFSEGRADHLFTTQTEMESFIAGMDDADDNMYVYTLSKTPGGRNVPIVIFTHLDLSGVKTVEEAAKLIIADSEANGKLTVHHQAFMHGDEPAAGETALAMIKYYDEDLGEKLLDKMNIYVIPWLNPDGAYKHLRTELGSCLSLNYVKKRYHIMADVMFQPHVAFDNHEADAAVQWTRHNHADMLISPSFNVESNQDFINISKAITDQAFVALKEQGMSYNYYTALINHSDGTGTRSYYARKGVMTFLMESCGAFSGRTAYERRTLAGVISCESLLTSIYNDAENVKAIIVAEQKNIIEEGKTFSEDDIVPLHVTKTEHPEFSYVLQSINTATGEGRPETVIPTIYDNVVRYRVAPTAYVIPAGQSWNGTVLELCDRLGLVYTQIPAGSTVLLRQYTGDGNLADLTEEAEVTFEQGAYVICMNQANSRNLAYMMEPDHGDGTGGEVSLVQTKVIPVTNGTMPIYRYEHDLNSEGFIDLVGEEEEILRGDMNGDGAVSDADALYLLRHTLFEERYPISQSGDVNGDGIVSDADALYLLRFTLFEDRYPLHS